MLPVPESADLRERKQRVPYLTFIACAACMIIFFGLLAHSDKMDWAVLGKWGYHSSDGVRNGAIWSLFTSCFVHIAVWHFLFNLYWLFHLGKALEQAIGSLWWFLFFVGAAFVSSGYQLGVSGDTGHGASGVLYAMFGYMWLHRKQVRAFAELLDRQTVIVMFVWLVGCIVATELGLANIGNSAHVTGLMFGVLCGAITRWNSWRRPIVAGLAVFIMGSMLTVFWAPWSADWAAWKALRAHEKEDYRSAIRWYDRAETLGFEKTWCLHNKGESYWSLGDTSSYNRVLATLREIDKMLADELERSVATNDTPAK